jgi:23S rRNA pseudouridine1911/1915/1917 synthase
MKTKILFEDSHILVIHKPAGIAVQSARVGQMDVESELRNYLATEARKTAKGGSSNPYIGLVHRLDQPVEGVLVVAKTKDAAAKLNKQLTLGSLNKKYLAVVSVESDQAEDAGTIIDYMIKDGQVAKIISSNVAEAKEARMHYKLLKKADNIALADIEIETGRFHQIRCQMAHHGMPLLGDAKYGSNESAALSQHLGVRNVALCANRISFKHPVTGKFMEFEVDPANPAFGKFL